MSSDFQLKDTLHITVSNCVKRMEALEDSSDRRSLFQEYKEWLGQDISDEVLSMPAMDCNHEIIDT